MDTALAVFIHLMPRRVVLTLGILYFRQRFWVMWLAESHHSIKDGQRSNIGGEFIEKRAILVTSARLTEVAIHRKHGDYDDSVHFGVDELE